MDSNIERKYLIKKLDLGRGGKKVGSVISKVESPGTSLWLDGLTKTKPQRDTFGRYKYMYIKYV